MQLLDSMSHAVTEVVSSFRTRAATDPGVRQPIEKLLAAGEDLIAAMERERKFDSDNDLAGWKAQMDVVDRLVLQYLDALTACRSATRRTNGRV
jgi:hypothetical protein